MDRDVLARLTKVVGYGILGALVTAATTFVLLPVTDAVQRPIYTALYLAVGPSDATEAAILSHFLGVATLGISAAMLTADALDTRLANLRGIGLCVGILVGLLGAFLVVTWAGLASFLTAIGVLALLVLTIPVVLRYRFGVRSGAVPAVIGTVPVLVLVLGLAGFGLGWGWGYIVIAEEAPGATGPTVQMDDAPEVEADLFDTANCESTGDGLRECVLQLRGYDHELPTVRFLDRHGVRCPYQNPPVGHGGTMLVQRDGTVYRVSCSPHGD